MPLFFAINFKVGGSMVDKIKDIEKQKNHTREDILNWIVETIKRRKRAGSFRSKPCWFFLPDMHMCVRLDTISISGFPISDVLCFESFTVNTDKRRQGVFSGLLDYLEGLGYAMYVEDVHEIWLEEYLVKKRGFSPISARMHTNSCSFFKGGM